MGRHSKRFDKEQVSPEDIARWKVIETALKMLMVNSFNYTKTASQSKVGLKALRKWAQKYGKMVLGDAYDPEYNGNYKGQVKLKEARAVNENAIEAVLLPQTLIEAEKQLFVTTHTVVEEANKAMIMAINRLKILLPEADIEKTKDVMLALNEISGEPRQQLRQEKQGIVAFVMNQIITNKESNADETPFIELKGNSK